MRLICLPPKSAKHSDMPFLSCKGSPPGSKINKLMLTIERNEKYIVYYIHLKQTIENGLKVEIVNIILLLLLLILM